MRRRLPAGGVPSESPWWSWLCNVGMRFVTNSNLDFFVLFLVQLCISVDRYYRKCNDRRTMCHVLKSVLREYYFFDKILCEIMVIDRYSTNSMSKEKLRLRSFEMVL